MTRHCATRIFCVTMAALLSACSLFKSAVEPAPSTAAQAPKLVGRIASIPAGRKFVLIQSYGPWNIESGSILTSRGLENRSANLLVTGESLGQFAAADIQSGNVEIGDAVYSRHVPKPPASQPEPELQLQSPEDQPLPESENVQKNI